MIGIGILSIYLVAWAGWHAANLIVDFRRWSVEHLFELSIPNILALYAIPALAYANGVSLAEVVPVATIVFASIDFISLVRVLRENAEARSYGLLWFTVSVWAWAIRLGWMVGLVYWMYGGGE